MCPGLCLNKEHQAADQKRSYSIEEAADVGVDFYVLGRALSNSKIPRQDAEKVLEKISRVSL